MTHHMTIELTEQEYATLAAEAAKSGKKPETLLHEMMRQHLLAEKEKRKLSGEEIDEMLFREGLVDNLPTRRFLTYEELAERVRVGEYFSSERSMSEIVKEDRGPY